MNWTELLRYLPGWVLAFMATIAGAVIVYAMAVAGCTTEIFGLAFGPKRECVARADYASAPPGTILAWDPVVRDAQSPVEKRRQLPPGWQICNGSNGTPLLDQRFLMGVAAVQEAGKSGGSNELTATPDHTHGGFTAALTYRPGEINWSANAGHPSQFSHVHGIEPDGGHNHGGDKKPAYYSIVFLCKVGD